MKQEIYMAREIETKCIHLEEEENSINHEHTEQLFLP